VHVLGVVREARAVDAEDDGRRLGNERGRIDPSLVMPMR